MARLVPDEPLPGTSPAELRVAQSLRRLPDTWIAIHSVAWQSKRDGRPGDGEADFVLVHPKHGVIVVEVKGGGIEVDRGRWYTTDRRGETHPIKSPFEQATSSKHALVRFLQEGHGVGSFLPAGHLVVFPDLSSLGDLGPSAPPAISWTDSDLDDVRSSIERLIAHWDLDADLTTGQVDGIVRRLAPTLSFRPLLRDQVRAAVTDLVGLTEQQISVLDGLRRTRRALIFGGAGTGKTILAAERARRLANEGNKTLLTCFNRPLGEYLRSVLAGETLITVASFHSFATSEFARAGGELPRDPPSDWFDVRLPAALPDAAERNGTVFDAIVVDEGQDFDPTWWTVLSLLLADPDESPFYVFADTQQAIYRSAWEPPFDGLEYELTINCRNTRPIADRVAAVFGSAGSETLGASGPEPRLHIIDGFGDVGAALKSALNRLLVTERLKPSDVVVLSTSRDVVDAARQRSIGPHKLVPAGELGVVVETVHRFKGLEADAVLLIALDSSVDSRALMYIGFSRARAYLEVICSRDVADAVGWLT